MAFLTPHTHHQPLWGLVGFGGERKSRFFPRNTAIAKCVARTFLSISDPLRALFCPFSTPCAHFLSTCL